MIFSSIFFIFIFLPIACFLYFIAKNEYRNPILLIASLGFYAYGDVKAVLLMLSSIVINYSFARGIAYVRSRSVKATRQNGTLKAASASGKNGEKQNHPFVKTLLVLDIIANLAILGYFKYANFALRIVNRLTGAQFSALDVVLPLGISFFTFQAMSYVIDVYRGEVEAEYSILNVGLYVSFFPQLIAGPIVRYKDIAQQIRKRETSIEKFGEGAKRFVLGVGKKILLANHLAIVAEATLGNVKNDPGFAAQMPVSYAWLGMLCFTLQIYFDFSAYSDMAIGLGRMFGFDIGENFNYPYISQSVTEFWRRWHISLSRWFRDYVYIPLGGSRKGTRRTIYNLLIVWLLTGLWHGANESFILWGLLYYVFQLLERYVLKVNERKNIVFRAFWTVVTLLVINIGWVLFDVESVSGTVRYVMALLGSSGNALHGVQTMGALREQGVYILAGVIFSTPIAPYIRRKLENKRLGEAIMAFGTPIVYMAMLMWCVSFMILGAHNPFIYFNF